MGRKSSNGAVVIAAPPPVMVRLADLNEATYNPRFISDEDLRSLKASLRKHGVVESLVVQKKGMTLIAGHQRLRALREMAESGEAVVPEQISAVVLDVNDSIAKQLNITLNKVGGEFDRLKLGQVLADIHRRADFDASAIGFQSAEIDRLVASVTMGGDAVAERDPDPGPLPKNPKSKTGDLVHLGEHVLYCGSCDDFCAWLKKAGVFVQLLIADPPYGVDYGSKGKGRAIIDDDKAPEVMRSMWEGWFGNVASVMKPGGGMYVFGPSEKTLFAHLMLALSQVGFYVAQTLVWVKNQHVLSRSDYHYQHECFIYGWRRGSAHLAVVDRTQSTVWECDRPRTSTHHPMMKPVPLLRRAIANSSKLGDVVFDPFLGSGSTLIACEAERRRCVGSEIDLRYCDVIIKRWEEATGKKATVERAKPKARRAPAKKKATLKTRSRKPRAA